MDNLEERQREMQERNSAASKRKHAVAMGARVLILEVKNQRLRKQKTIVVERSPQNPLTKHQGSEIERHHRILHGPSSLRLTWRVH